MCVCECTYVLESVYRSVSSCRKWWKVQAEVRDLINTPPQARPQTLPRDAFPCLLLPYCTSPQHARLYHTPRLTIPRLPPPNHTIQYDVTMHQASPYHIIIIPHDTVTHSITPSHNTTQHTPFRCIIHHHKPAHHMASQTTSHHTPCRSSLPRHNICYILPHNIHYTAPTINFIFSPLSFSPTHYVSISLHTLSPHLYSPSSLSYYMLSPIPSFIPLSCNTFFCLSLVPFLLNTQTLFHHSLSFLQQAHPVITPVLPHVAFLTFTILFSFHHALSLSSSHLPLTNLSTFQYSSSSLPPLQY